MAELIVALDVAEAEFARWAEENDMVYTEEDFEKLGDADDKSVLSRAKSRIVRAITKGHAVINDEGLIVYTPFVRGSKDKEPITFYGFSGNTMLSKTPKNSDDNHRLFAMAAEMTHTNPGRIAGLFGADIKAVTAVVTFLSLA